MTTKHTPTPWEITNSGYDDNLIYKIQIGTSARTIAYAYSSDGDKQREQVANAAFIVHACNMHDELVAALRVARTLLATYGSGDTVHVCPHTGELLTPAIRQINAVLNNAETVEA